MNALLYSNGVCLTMAQPRRVRVAGAKRGKLTGRFSSASFRRLRQFCITHDAPGECWGLTLTIPGIELLDNAFVKSCVHSLTVWCNYRHVPMIWRCELQKRGQPHLHLVVYGSSRICLLLFLEWQKLIEKAGPCCSVETVSKHVKDIVLINRMFVNGSSHAFDMQRLSGDFRSWRYLVAHTSKGKQSQQGWVGRQWGVVCRDSLIEDRGLCYELDDRSMYVLRRWVRRLSRRRINSLGRHFLLCNPNTVASMIRYIKDDYFEVPF